MVDCCGKPNYEANLRATEEIEKINLAIAEKGLKWTAGLNPIAVLSDEEKRGLCGTIPLPEELKKKIIYEKVERLTLLPPFFDWKNWMTPVKNQGGCGSCWAFATVGSVEAKFRIEANNPSLDIDLSEQDLVSCANLGGCGGASNLYDPFVYIRDKGIVDENCFPYAAANIPCSPCGGGRLYKISNFSSFLYQNIKDALVQYGPLCCGLNIPTDIFYYNGGIYEPTTTSLISQISGHAVVLVGYNDIEGYWILKNSWGPNWGEQGYFKMSYSSGDSLFFKDSFHAAGGTIIPTIAYINVNAVPNPIGGAKIYLDEKYIGKTNSSYTITAGTHILKLISTGYYEATRTFTIAIEETQTLNIPLVKIPNKSFIEINSDFPYWDPDGASIYLDGTYISKTNFSFEIQPGPHALELIKINYKNYEETFTISYEEIKIVNAVLERLEGKAKIERITIKGVEVYPIPNIPNVWGDTFHIDITVRKAVDVDDVFFVIVQSLGRTYGLRWYQKQPLYYVKGDLPLADQVNIKVLVGHDVLGADIVDDSYEFTIKRGIEPPLYEYQTNSDGGWWTGEAGQVFTIGNVGPNENFNISSVEINGKGYTPIELYIHQGTTAAGAIISSGSIIPASGWVSCPMSPEVLSAGNSYFLHIKSGGGYEWEIGYLTPYGGVANIFKYLSGGTWHDHKGHDGTFKIYGGGPIPPKATINVNSNPTGANIYLDDNFIGKTNLLYEIVARTHTLKLTLAGYYDKTETFTISAGETKNVPSDINLIFFPPDIRFYKVTYPSEKEAYSKASIYSRIYNYGLIKGTGEVYLINRDTGKVLGSYAAALSKSQYSSKYLYVIMPNSIDYPSRILKLKLDLYSDDVFKESKSFDINLKEGKGDFVSAEPPATAKYNSYAKIYVTMANIGAYRDSIFFRIMDNDTNAKLGEYVSSLYAGQSYRTYKSIKMPNRNLSFRVEVGHKEGSLYVIDEVSPVYTIIKY